ncbi:MerR family transcriptional regulator [Stigmatella aurantiaca]|uniref:Transcriptional regulator MerR family n=1 Tax=Stigmatella aurantiaca (strain DW4/3-1) TaxID=378806 RepID=Q096X6_STIAD|nr:MerR family transcriptional regulator [Stigmatella aurantiaca]ADO71405.1 Transcriptional regulator, MerR family [Stigmatella aurantiaca DW4/3-1]EAU67785.1 transcriptional regulator MerR family [Stigmatella aurantiaca DW4/3-1]
MNIGELSKLSGASARSIRHYEKSGLLVSRRRSNGYRDFGPEAVPRVQHIVRMIGLGFSLEEIGTFSPCMFTREASGICPDALATHQAKLADIERRISDLESRRARLVETLTQAARPSATRRRK